MQSGAATEAIATDGAAGTLVAVVAVAADAADGLAEILASAGPGIAWLVVPTSREAADALRDGARLGGRFPVAAACDGLAPATDSICLLPPDAAFRVEGGRLREEPGAGGSLDLLLASLGEHFGDRVVAVLLSEAAGTRGHGLRVLHECGGTAIARTRGAGEDPKAESREPKAEADRAMTPARMGGWLQNHTRRLAERTSAAPAVGGIGLHLVEICSVLHAATGHDFGGYKEGTLRRRVLRRMQERKVASGAEYLRVLRGDPSEPPALLRELLVGVTQFFRDPEAFAALAGRAVAGILSAPGDGPLRIWVPACASGEEAYTLAMLVMERRDAAGSTRPLQIFASDADRESLAVARRGLYPAGVEAHVPPALLDRYFVRRGDGWEATRELREPCVFTAHDLLRDPPFRSIDLVSCRNALIYLGADLQRRLVPVLHQALRPGGWLFLGSAEGVGEHEALFEAVDARHRIFRRREVAVRPAPAFPLARPLRDPPPPADERAAAPARPEAGRAFDRLVLQEFAPACAAVTERGEVVFVAGPTSRYFQPPPGAPAACLFDLVRGPLRRVLRASLESCVRSRRTVVRDGVAAEVDGGRRALRVTVQPMAASERDPGLFAVVLQELPAAAAAPEPPPEPAGVERLETELRTVCEELRVAVEERESATEELKAANEELLSANEELRSSQEELESANEELETVNTDLRRRVREVAAAHADLREADRRRSDFLALLSHELRNPLAPIRSSLLVLDRAAPGSDAARRAREILDRQAGQLSRLVDDLLDLTRITRGKLHLRRARADLGEVVRRACEDHRALFDQAGVRLEAPAPARPLPVMADAARLTQLVGNLVQNAVKFTPPGGCTRVSAEAGAAEARIVVRDTGAGMTPAMLARLFEPFAQGEETLDRSRGGLGLGLALVRGIAELHGGRASASSPGPGEGSEFVVTLPLALAGDETAPAHPDAARRTRRVLIVEDNADAADSLRDALELEGHEVAVAYDGAAGVARARELRPDVVLCDLGLPGLDGYEVARRLRSDATLRATLLVALSGYAQPEDRTRAAEAGFDRHLAKPPDFAQLAEVLQAAAAGVGTR